MGSVARKGYGFTDRRGREGTNQVRVDLVMVGVEIVEEGLTAAFRIRERPRGPYLTPISLYQRAEDSWVVRGGVVDRGRERGSGRSREREQGSETRAGRREDKFEFGKKRSLYRGRSHSGWVIVFLLFVLVTVDYGVIPASADRFTFLAEVEVNKRLQIREIPRAVGALVHQPEEIRAAAEDRPGVGGYGKMGESGGMKTENFDRGLKGKQG